MLPSYIAFWEAVSCLRSHDLDMVVVLVTKMDQYEPGGAWPSAQCIQRDIRRLFKEEAEVDRVIFSHSEMNKYELIDSMFHQVKDMPLRQLQYNKFEIVEHFGMTQMTCVSKVPSLDNVGTSKNNKRPLVLHNMSHVRPTKTRKIGSQENESVLQLSTSCQISFRVEKNKLPRNADALPHQSKIHQGSSYIERNTPTQKVTYNKKNTVKFQFPEHTHKGRFQKLHKEEISDEFDQESLGRINYDANFDQARTTGFYSIMVILRQAAICFQNIMCSIFFGESNE